MLGNHEFYGRHISWRPTDLPDNFILLDSTKVIIEGVIFAGTTLWSHITDVYSASAYLNDFYNIRTEEGQFTVRYYNWLFSQAKEWLLNEEWDVLITHHAPRLESIHPNSLCNDCFASDIPLASNKIAIHGHTHKSFDYRLENNTRVVCSPWGYPAENIYPTMEKVIEV